MKGNLDENVGWIHTLARTVVTAACSSAEEGVHSACDMIVNQKSSSNTNVLARILPALFALGVANKEGKLYIRHAKGGPKS